MSHDKLIHMANQIATFFESKPHAEGVEGVAAHINAYWEPRMRRHLFEVVDAGGAGTQAPRARSGGRDQTPGRSCLISSQSRG